MQALAVLLNVKLRIVPEDIEVPPAEEPSMKKKEPFKKLEPEPKPQPSPNSSQ